MKTRTSPHDSPVRAHKPAAQSKPEPMPNDPDKIEAWAQREGARVAALPEAQQQAELTAMLAEVESIQRSIPPPLTETQSRRLAKRVAGESLAQIAASEGKSKSAVAETLKSPAVRMTVSILGRSLSTVDNQTGEPHDMVLDLLTATTMIALNAKKPIVLTAASGETYIEYVPDEKLRADTAFRLLGLVDHSSKPKSATAGKSTDEVADHEIIAERVQRSETTERVTARARRNPRT